MPDGRKPRVLDVGQCALDHSNISEMIKRHFDAVVDRAGSSDQVMHMVGFYDYDLVLVNRVLDEDGTEGIQLIRRLRAEASTRSIPVMLVSNHTDAQDAACAAGAVPGFGKASLEDSASAARLEPFLGA